MNQPTTSDRDTQRARNPVTLQRLAANGSDLSHPHVIQNVFHVYDQRNLAGLCEALEAARFDLRDRGTPLVFQGTSYWNVEACRETVPELESLNRMTDDCVALATEHEADYDGWYTEVVSHA